MVAVCDPLDRFERKLDLEAHAADILEQVGRMGTWDIYEYANAESRKDRLTSF